jgi:hypothetical protein
MAAFGLALGHGPCAAKEFGLVDTAGLVKPDQGLLVGLDVDALDRGIGDRRSHSGVKRIGTRRIATLAERGSAGARHASRVGTHGPPGTDTAIGAVTHGGSAVTITGLL